MIATCKRIKLGLYLIPHTKINSKWIICLNVRAKIIKVLEENLGVNLHDLGLDKDSLCMTPKSEVTKEKTGKLDLIKIFKICVSKDTSKKVKRQSTE